MSPTPSSPSSSLKILLNSKPIVILKKPNELSGPSDVESSSFEDSIDTSKVSLIVGETSSETEDGSCAISETSYDSDDDDNDPGLFKYREPSSISEVYDSRVYDSRVYYSSDDDDLAMNYPQPEPNAAQDASSTKSNRLKAPKKIVLVKQGDNK